MKRWKLVVRHGWVLLTCVSIQGFVLTVFAARPGMRLVQVAMFILADLVVVALEAANYADQKKFDRELAGYFKGRCTCSMEWPGQFPCSIHGEPKR